MIALGIVVPRDGSVIPYGAAGVAFDVPWMVAYPNQAMAAAAAASEETATIAWSVDCGIDGFVFEGDLQTDIPLDATQSQYEGTSSFRPIAPKTVVPGTIVACTILAVINEGQDDENTSSAVVRLPVGYDGPFNASLAVTERQGGPQKTINYPIELSNDGSTPILVSFELPDRGGKDWSPIVPVPVVLEPKSTLIVDFVVATPFENGYNKGSTGMVVRAVPHAPDNPDLAGEPIDLDVTAKVRGFYIPGPSPMILVAALAVLAAGRRALA